jgi:hypothetical protein
MEGVKVYGSIQGINHRLLANLVCRYRHHPGTLKAGLYYPSYYYNNVNFCLVDTGSPIT